jgi:hypothetical protein
MMQHRGLKKYQQDSMCMWTMWWRRSWSNIFQRSNLCIRYRLHWQSKVRDNECKLLTVCTCRACNGSKNRKALCWT